MTIHTSTDPIFHCTCCGYTGHKFEYRNDPCSPILDLRSEEVCIKGCTRDGEGFSLLRYNSEGDFIEGIDEGKEHDSILDRVHEFQHEEDQTIIAKEYLAQERRKKYADYIMTYNRIIEAAFGNAETGCV